MLAVTTASAASTTRHREGEVIGQSSPHLRSLTSMLSNHSREHICGARKARAPLKEETENEVELESSSLFVKLEQSDISPLFSAEESSDLTRSTTYSSSSPRPPPLPNARQFSVQRTREDGAGGKSTVPMSPTTNNQEDQSIGRDHILGDLFPISLKGFTRTVEPPMAKKTEAEDLPRKTSNTNTLAGPGKQSELKGTQAWTRLVPSSVPPAMAAVNACQQDMQHGQKSQKNHDAVVSSQELSRPSTPEVDLSSALPHPDFGKLQCDAYKKSGEHHKVEPAVVGVPMEASSINGDVIICNAPNEGERECVLTKASVVVVREREEELKRALDRLVPRLLHSEERVKYVERRLQEAMRDESGRNALFKQVAKLESEVKHLRERLELRHREALEWRDMKQTLEADNSRLKTELHHTLDRGVLLDIENRRLDALLVEARAKADGLTEKNSRLEIELRHNGQLLGESEKERKRAWQTTNMSADTMAAAVRRAEAAATEADNLHNEARRRERAPSTLESQRQSSLARLAEAADGEWVGKRLSWEPELDRPSSTPIERNQCRGRSLCSNRDRPAGQTKRYPVDDSTTLGGQNFDSRHDVIKCSSTTSPPTGDSLAQRSASDIRNGNELRTMGRGFSSDSKGIREELTAPMQESVWTHDVDNIPPVAARTKGREQYGIGDRQRYDSEGVKGALTAASPEWAGKAPAGKPPKTTSGCDYTDNISKVGPISKVESSGCQMQMVCADIDRGGSDGAQWRDTQSVRGGTGESLLTELAAVGWTPSPQSFPPAGHRTGRDVMSSRRSSLSGAGIGVHSRSNDEMRQAPKTENIATASKEGSTDLEMLTSAHGTTDLDCRNAVDSASWRAPTRPTFSLADVIRKKQVNAQPERTRHERESIPFATDAVEDELRPVREVENKLMLFQMEASQLEAEQRKLSPKASKTISSRIRMRDIESRLEWLAKESSGLRRILRSKPWRM